MHAYICTHIHTYSLDNKHVTTFSSKAMYMHFIKCALIKVWYYYGPSIALELWIATNLPMCPLFGNRQLAMSCVLNRTCLYQQVPIITSLQYITLHTYIHTVISLTVIGCYIVG